MPDLPNAAMAYVDQAKIVDYLLSPESTEGKAKSNFFHRFGFRRAEWESFAEALRQHGGAYPVKNVVESEYGTKYVVEGEIVTPDGRNPYIKSVWMMDKDEFGVYADVPRLVTAYRP